MARLTRDDWLRAAWARVSADGVDGVSVEALARELGATKGSFYWHFEDREALLTAALEQWEHVGTERIIARVEEHADADPAARVHRLMLEVFAHPEADSVEVGIRAWARHHEGARAAVARVDARRQDYVTSLLEAAGVSPDEARWRAAAVYRALIGDFTINAHGGGRMEPQAVREMVRLVLSAVA